MTAEKALDYFERRKERLSLSDLVQEAEDCALSAIKKQIPKKPLPYKGWEGECPTCGVIFIDRTTKYCGNCGQALDWSDTNA